MPIRLKDIAVELGVSAVTVSKVLRNHPDVGSQTRERVLKRVRELNYRPNFAARALVTGRTFTIGLVVPDLVYSFFAQVANGASQVLRKRGYNLIISSSEADPELELKEIEELVARRVDALLIASAQQQKHRFEQLTKSRVPFVLIDRRIADITANFVGVDDEAVGFLATSHLLEVGCKNIAHIAGSQVSTGTGRLNGYRRALAEKGIVSSEDLVVLRERIDEGGEATGYEAMQNLLRLDPRPDGVFCFNDPTAMGAMKAILDAGLRIPHDIAVAGAGNVRYSDFLRVPLTTVDQDSANIGARAAQLALAQVESSSQKRPKILLLEPKLIARESTRR